jgi:hypothetical protein
MGKYKYIMLLISVIIIAGCHNDNHAASANLATPFARVTELKKYLNLKTEVLDAEFDIFDVNLNADWEIPGPTGRDYKIALLVKPEDVDVWLRDVTPTSFPLDYSWAHPLLKNDERFHIDSPPLMFTGEDKELILFRRQGIILIRIRQD